MENKLDSKNYVKENRQNQSSTIKDNKQKGLLEILNIEDNLNIETSVETLPTLTENDIAVLQKEVAGDNELKRVLDSLVMIN